MRIGELAHQAGVTVKAVRYYESLGLITPTRLSNGYRDYSEVDVRHTAEIRALARLGIPVERTQPFLDCLSAGHPHADDCPASLAEYRDAIADLTARIHGLTTRRDALIAHLNRAAHRGCTTTPADQGTDMPDFTSLPADLPVPADDGAADHLPGTPLPPLVLRATDGSTITLDELGPGRTVIYLYPLTGRPGIDLPEGWDAIPGARGCSTEACDFRDHYRDLVDAGATQVFGCSSQDVDYQREVVERLHLPFPMLSDPNLELARALDLPTFAPGDLDRYRPFTPNIRDELYSRLTMIVREGLIEHVFYPIFPPNEHAGQVLRWLRAHLH
ncbi:redoxin family protein [Tsukamurella soli]|uniref:Redoxin family protein n=1 Tax=Tsukamurella soli TaxID=644556 RepID=A0ABP8K8R2_9ACTN